MNINENNNTMNINENNLGQVLLILKSSTCPNCNNKSCLMGFNINDNNDAYRIFQLKNPDNNTTKVVKFIKENNTKFGHYVEISKDSFVICTSCQKSWKADEFEKDLVKKNNERI